MGTSINCLGGANFQYPRTNSVGYIKQIHHCVLKACALKREFLEVALIRFQCRVPSGRICLPQIITALRTVLFISHPFRGD